MDSSTSIGHLWRKWRALRDPIRGDLVRVAFLMVLVRLAVPLRSLPAAMRWADRLGGSVLDGDHAYGEGDCADLVRGVGRYLPGTTGCLVEAIVLRALLRREGSVARMRIGVARDEGGSLRAHAWVETEHGTYFEEPTPEGGYALLQGTDHSDSLSNSQTDD